MAVKDIIKYYDEVCDVYHELFEDLKEVEKEFNEGLLSPERFEQYKRNIEPIKANYERLSYIIYLLNKPQRKSKTKSYERQHKKELEFFKENNLINRDINESKECLNTIKENRKK